jgi:hypothetical protein
MELVSALKCFDHLACFQGINTDGAVVRSFIPLCFFVAECSVGVDNVYNLLFRKLWFTLLIVSLLLEELLLACVERVSSEVHLDVLWIHVRHVSQVSHHVRQVLKHCA